MGFNIVKLKEDQQLYPVRVVLADIQIDLNASLSNEHIPEI